MSKYIHCRNFLGQLETFSIWMGIFVNPWKLKQKVCKNSHDQNIIAASMYFWSVSLVYQLFGQFLIFLVDQKKIWLTKKNFGIAKKNLVYQKKMWYTKKKFGWPKKWDIDQTIGIPKKLTKSTWTPLLTQMSQNRCQITPLSTSHLKKRCSGFEQKWKLSEIKPPLVQSKKFVG